MAGTSLSDTSSSLDSFSSEDSIYLLFAFADLGFWAAAMASALSYIALDFFATNESFSSTSGTLFIMGDASLPPIGEEGTFMEGGRPLMDGLPPYAAIDGRPDTLFYAALVAC